MSNTNGSGAKVTSPATPVTTSTFNGFNRKGIDDSTKFPPLPETIEHTTVVSDQLKFLSDDQIKKLQDLTLPTFYSLNQGCYLVNFTPVGTIYHYDGTIRVQKVGTNTIASGDLYYHKPFTVWPKAKVIKDPEIFQPNDNALSLFGEPNPANGVPVFSRANYRYYLKITQILESISLSKSFTLGFEMWRFNGASATPMGSNEGVFKAEVSFATAPAGYPSGASYLIGAVKNPAGTIVGNLTMGWVSKYVRSVIVEIDRVKDSEAPVISGSGHTWQSVFDQVDWKINVIESNNNVAEVSGDSWSDGEMHAGMMKWRDSADLDSEWRYHILAVNLIDSTPRGIMYDAGSTDSNNVPREGIGIASNWIIPNDNIWGKVKGMRFGTAAAPYFRTALHEIGHAMGLYHNTVDMGIMNTTDVIAASATAAVKFPDNIKWAHAADDQKRLRHMPDIFVRPGGVPFGTNYSVHPLSPDDESEFPEGLQLTVTPLQDVLPIGAPVRLEISLLNISSEYLPAPGDLNIKNGCIAGKVTDPTGNVRSFKSVIICVDETPLKNLKPGEKITDSLTLLRGVEGALFSVSGSYTIEVEVSWDLKGGHVTITDEANVYVTPAVDDAHARAAMKVLSTPDTLLSLAITGDHLVKGNEAINVALQNPVLRPYYTYIEAKRLAKPFGKRKSDIKAAANLMKQKAVMSASETKKAIKLFEGVSDEDKHDARDAVSVISNKQQMSTSNN